MIEKHLFSICSPFVYKVIQPIACGSQTLVESPFLQRLCAVNKSTMLSVSKREGRLTYKILDLTYIDYTIIEITFDHRHLLMSTSAK